MERYKLLKELMELDFMATDLQLFLDTHPNNMDALEKFNSVIVDAKKIRMQYEKKYGPLNAKSEPLQKWDWIDEPWPWDNKANFNFSREDD